MAVGEGNAGGDSGPPERQIKDFSFKLMCKIRATSQPVNADYAQLLTVASNYGLIFIGIETGVLVLRTADLEILAEQHRGSSNANEICDEFPKWKSFLTLSPPTHLALNGDQTILSVSYVRDGCAFMSLYDIGMFGQKDDAVLSYMEFTLSNDPSTGQLKDVAWNPTVPTLFAYCLSNGRLRLINVKDGKLNIVGAIGGPSPSFTSVCWSPKGKQLVAGTSDGNLIQHDQELKPKKMNPPPGPNLEVLDVFWHSTSTFFAAFKTAGSDDEQPNVYIIHTKKDQLPESINFEDVCFGNGDDRKPKYYFKHVPNWDIVLASSANALEVNVMGRNDKNKNLWELWSLEDSGRAEFSLTENYENTYPVGAGMDYTANKHILISETQSLPPSPILVLLSTDGVLILFYVLYTSEGAPSLTQPAQRVPGVSKKSISAVVSQVDQPRQSSVSAPATDPPALQGAVASLFKLPGSTGTSSFDGAALLGAKPGTAPSSGFAAFGSKSVTAPSLSGATKPESVPSSGASSFSGAATFGAKPGSVPSGGVPSFSGAATFGAKPGSVPSSGASFSGSATFGAKSDFTTSSSFSGNAPVFGSSVKLGSDSMTTTSFDALASATGTTQSSSTAVSAPVTEFHMKPASTVSKPVTASSQITAPKPEASSAPPVTTQVQASLPVKQTEPLVKAVKASTPKPPAAQQGMQAQKKQPREAAQEARPRQPQEDKNLSVESTFTKGIFEEIEHFNKELAELKARTKQTNFHIGTRDEAKQLTALTAEMASFCKEAKETTKYSNEEIHQLKSDVLEAFAIAEDGNIQHHRMTEPRFQNLHRSRALDLASSKKLRDIRMYHQYVTTCLEDVNLKLDIEWEQHSAKKQRDRRLHAPMNDTLYQALTNNHNLIVGQQYHLNKLISEMEKLKMYNAASVWENGSYGTSFRHTESKNREKGDEYELSSLADSLVESRTFSKPFKVQSVSPEKQSRLRQFLGERTAVPVKSTAPGNLSLSKVISVEKLREMQQTTRAIPDYDDSDDIYTAPEEAPPNDTAISSMAPVDGSKLQQTFAAPVSPAMRGLNIGSAVSSAGLDLTPKQTTTIGLNGQSSLNPKQSSTTDFMSASLQSPSSKTSIAVISGLVVEEITPPSSPEPSEDELVEKPPSAGIVHYGAPPAVKPLSQPSAPKDAEMKFAAGDTGGLAKTVFAMTPATTATIATVTMSSSGFSFGNSQSSATQSPGFSFGGIQTSNNAFSFGGTPVSTSVAGLSLIGSSLSANSAVSTTPVVSTGAPSKITFGDSKSVAVINKPVTGLFSLTQSKSVPTKLSSLSNAVPSSINEESLPSFNKLGLTSVDLRELQEEANTEPSGDDKNQTVSVVKSIGQSTLYSLLKSESSGRVGTASIDSSASCQSSGSETKPVAQKALFGKTHAESNSGFNFGSPSLSSDTKSAGDFTFGSTTASLSKPAEATDIASAETEVSSSSDIKKTESVNPPQPVIVTVATTTTSLGTVTSSGLIRQTSLTTSGGSLCGTAPSVGVFGSAGASGSGVFGAKSTDVTTATTSSTGVFGGSANSSNLTFGNIATSGSIFGGSSSTTAVTTTTPSTGVFSSATGFGSQAGSVSSSSVFGGTFSTSQTTSASVFGTPSSTAVVSAPSSVFDSSTSTAQTTASTGFGETPSTSGFSFGSTPSQSSSPFAGTGNKLFGETSGSGSVFGSSTSQPSSVFGQPSSTSGITNLFGQQASTSGFGSQQTVSQSENGSLFGGGGGGSGLFGGLGGKPSTEKANQNPFGSSTFGSPATSQASAGLFGKQTALGFGQTSTTTSGSSAFGGGGSVASHGFGGFGGGLQSTGGFGGASTFGVAPTFGFGSPSTFGGSPGFGGAPTFGSSPFGSGSGGFGSAGHVFGSSTGDTQQGTVFGTSTTTPTFGSLAQPPGTPSFGNLSQGGDSSGFGNFGGAPAFGQSSAQQSPSFNSYRS